ncbi:glycosyltransferase [Candidatus Saccharibacteria bacterium]|nr:glycosyltransferase [Candidatus Saccharibacteria bacterium]
MNEPLISIIIPCHNEAATIGGLLDDLRAQTDLPYGSFEVIVVDSASTDGTGDAVRTHGDGLPLQVVRVDEPGASLARNRGAAVARGYFFMFCDADVRLPRLFIEAARKEMGRRDLTVAGFKQRILSSSLSMRAGGRLMNGYALAMSITPWPIFFSCYIVQRDLFRAIGGIDESLYLMEDYDVALRAKRAGGSFGIITGTYFLSSPRRYEGQDGLQQLKRGFYGEFYRYTHGLRVDKPIYEYKMGGEDKPKK